jgi:hypothetical protein
MYFEKHYLTVTGEVVEGFPETINEVDPELIIQLYDKWFLGKRTSGKAEVNNLFKISHALSLTHIRHTLTLNYAKMQERQRQRKV